jgi:hypothetical protein
MDLSCLASPHFVQVANLLAIHPDVPMPIQRQVRKLAAAGFHSRLKLFRWLSAPLSHRNEHENGWLVIAVVHRDDNAKETGNFGHDIISISILQPIVF